MSYQSSISWHHIISCSRSSALEPICGCMIVLTTAVNIVLPLSWTFFVQCNCVFLQGRLPGDLVCYPVIQLSGTGICGIINRENIIYDSSTTTGIPVWRMAVMGKSNGLDICHELLQINPRTNVIFLTSYIDYSFDAWKTGACGFLMKPLTEEKVKKQLSLLRYPFGGVEYNFE